MEKINLKVKTVKEIEAEAAKHCSSTGNYLLDQVNNLSYLIGMLESEYSYLATYFKS